MIEDNPNEVDKYYLESYLKVHSYGVLGFANSYMHKRLERNSNKYYQNTLEIGSGNFEHYKFISHEYGSLFALDIREPELSLKQKFLQDNSKNKFILGDALKLPFEDDYFDRVYATCLVVHIADVRALINEWIRVIKPDGQIDFVIPCDPGLLLRIFRKFVSVPTARKMGVSESLYEFVNNEEHISSFSRTIKLVKFATPKNRKLKIRYYPFNFLRSWNFNAFAIVSICDRK
jgi:ubiquinone/menaquinone biosynthesis C-methylase UbiE